MDLTTITVQDFKTLFFRDFPYLPVWVSTKTYNTDDKVYYEVTSLFYTAKSDGVTSTPVTEADWDTATDDILNYVLDADITKALAEASINFNQSLFSTDEQITLAFLYLAAHFLAIDLQRSAQGVNSSGNYTAQAQSVGNVSETLYVPDKLANNPIYQLYTTTGYGMKYLNLVLPRLVGRVSVVAGDTNA